MGIVQSSYIEICSVRFRKGGWSSTTELLLQWEFLEAKKMPLFLPYQEPVSL